MKNKLPLIVGAVVIVVAAIFFMQGGDKTAKKGGDSAQPIIIATHNWSSPNCNGSRYWGNFWKHGK